MIIKSVATLPPARAALVHTMAPWLEHIERRIDAHIPQFSHASDFVHSLWIDFRLSNRTLSVKDVEAMEMLELFARVEYRVAWEAIFFMTRALHHTEDFMDATLAAGKKVYPRFAILDVEEPFLEGHFKTTFKNLLLRTNPAHHSPYYFRDRETLLQRWADQHGGTPFRRSPDNLIQIKFVVTVHEFNAAFSGQIHGSLAGVENTTRGERLLAEVATVAAFSQDSTKLEQCAEWKMHDRLGQVVPVSDVFRLEWVESIFPNLPVTSDMVRSIQAMLESSGIGIDTISFSQVNYRDPRLDASVGAKFFQTLLGAENYTKPPSTLRLSKDVSSEVFAGACSALMVNTSVRRFVVHLPESDFRLGKHDEGVRAQNGGVEAEEKEDAHDAGIDIRDPFVAEDQLLFWAWMAYSIFSAEANHRIEDLTLRPFLLRQVHIDVFTRVLTARDPLAYLHSSRQGRYQEPSAAEASREPSVVDIAPRSTILLSRSNGSSIVSSNQVKTLRVVFDSPGQANVCVVYPGAGVCWVARTDIISHCTIASPSKPASSIRRLTVEIANSMSRSALVSFLELVGAEITTLVLHSRPSFRLNEDHFQRILAACRQLRHLSLGYVVVVNFDWLSTFGSRLEGLSLHSVTSSSSDGYPNLFMRHASSPTQLRELHIMSQQVRCDLVFPSMLQMLDTISRIERLFVSMVLAADQGNTGPTYRQALQQRHDRPLLLPKLSLHSKLAFLSVISKRDDDADSGVGSEHRTIETAVMAMIFAFAAPNKTRVCEFKAFSDIW